MSFDLQTVMRSSGGVILCADRFHSRIRVNPSMLSFLWKLSAGSRKLFTITKYQNKDW